MSWLFSQALVEEFSADTCSGGEPCAQLNVMPTPHKFWRSDKTIEPFDHSRFGLTSAVLTADRGEALLTSFLAASRAKTSARPAKAPASMAFGPASGRRWPALLARFDPASSTWRTAQSSLLGGWDEFSETWPRLGSMRNGESFLRPTLALPTFESESGFWLPTPCAIDTGSRFNRSDSPGAALRPTLGVMAKFGLWPTPTVYGNHNRPGASASAGWGLSSAVKLWPTPTTIGLNNGSNSRAAIEKRGGGPLHGGALNPTWVEWLMGWPIGWTALQPLEMDKFREWQLQHSQRCAGRAEA